MVDFLGGAPKQKQRASASVEMHIPAPPQRQPRHAPHRQEAVAARAESVRSRHEQDLAHSYTDRRRRTVIFAAVVSGILLISAAGLWYAFTPRGSTPPPQVAQPQPPTPPPVAAPAPATPPTPVAPAVSLPDTELAPLRGALIRFPGGSAIYLVETNGELRRIVTQSVIFKNGQRMSEVNRSLIYALPQRWESVRRGAEDVSGRVDFDPRVLTADELTPFL